MQIEITGKLTFKPLLGGSTPLSLEVEDGTTVEALLNTLGEMLGNPFCRLVFKSGEPDEKKIKPTFIVTVNGTAHWNLKRRLATPLSPGDKVQLTPILTGG